MNGSSKFAVAVHILTLLSNTPEPASSAYIAESVCVHPVTIRKVIGLLSKAGLVETIAGSNGGAILARQPDQINLRQVYDLIKDEFPFALPENQPSPYCPVGRNIKQVLIQLFDDTDRLIALAMSKITIADILEQVLAPV